MAGLAAALAALMLLALLPDGIRTTIRESLFDKMLLLSASAPAPTSGRIVVVDIDRESLAEIGSWPWPRGEIAQLVATAAGHGASSIALDVLFIGPDLRSPGSVARRLARETGDKALDRIAQGLTDGDGVLSEAMKSRPLVLAFLLDPRGEPLTSQAPVLIRGEADLRGLWDAAGVQQPIQELAEVAAGLGAASLPGDADGVIRRIPILVRTGAGAAPGLAAEALRVAAEASGYLVTGSPMMIAVGDAEIPLPPDGMLRLLPSGAAATPVRLRAADLTKGRTDPALLRNAIVLVGASAPELGGLRASLLGELTPSVDLHARAAWQILAGRAPARAPLANLIEIIAALVATAVVMIAAAGLRPRGAAAATTALAAAIAGAALVAASKDTLIDPTPALVAAAAAFLATSLADYARTRRRESVLRRRFEQHLAPGVVRRIVADPDSLKLQGERRRVTALFTDIADFSSTAAATEPEELISVLDGYFEGVASIIVNHGGMIDKFVGDAVHAFFNMPLDLESHADRAIVCATKIIAWTESYRGQGLAGRIALGRTRIGIETGDAIVGNVGVATKLDYTAHGNAVNVAARLEALNKDFGTAICVGPAAAAASASTRLRSLGLVEVRGVGVLELFAPTEP